MLPARDAADTVFEAAQSCLEQTFTDLELLCVANDATSETFQELKRTGASDSRVRLIEAPEGSGFIDALNLAWRESRGKYLARMDADDISFPERFARQIEWLEKNSGIVAAGCKVKIRRREADGSIVAPRRGYAEFEDWLNHCLTPGQIAAQRFIDSPIANPSAMLRREVFQSVGGYRKVDWAEDYDFWLRLLEKEHAISKVPEVLLEWRDSESRLTRNDPHYTKNQFLAAKAHFLARMPEVKTRGVAVCGAGPIGKRLARYLKKEGTRVVAFFEVNQRKIGRTIGGIPVRTGEALPRSSSHSPVLLGAVGLPGARERIRGLAGAAGYREGEDYFAVA